MAWDRNIFGGTLTKVAILFVLATTTSAKANCNDLAKPLFPLSVRAYQRDMGRHPILAKEEQQALLENFARTADGASRDKIITSNLRLAFAVAKKYATFYQGHFLDLVQEGNLGLMEAVSRYDPFSSENTSFGQYATAIIRRYIWHYLEDHLHNVRIKVHYRTRKKFARIKEGLEQQGLSVQQERNRIAQELEISPEMVDLIDTVLKGGEVPLNSEGHLEALAKETSWQRDLPIVKDPIFLRHLRNFLQTRTPKEREIFVHSFLSPNSLSQRELAQKYGIKQSSMRERVNRLQTAFKKSIVHFLSDSQVRAAKEDDPFAHLPRVQAAARKKLAHFVPAFTDRLPTEEEIRPFLEALPEKERDMFRRRFLSPSPPSLRNLAREYDLALTVAHKIENRSLKAFGEYMRRDIDNREYGQAATVSLVK